MSQNVGSAGGVDGASWFVAIMRKNNTEKASAEVLQKLGYNCYVATQKELRIWRNGKRTFIDRVVIPSLIFIYCTEIERRAIIHFPFISRFMMDKAGTASQPLTKPLAVIPQEQMERLQFMLGQSDTPVEFSAKCYAKGDRVCVIRGSLAGLEGEVTEVKDGNGKLIVSLSFLGQAHMTINMVDVQPVK